MNRTARILSTGLLRARLELRVLVRNRSILFSQLQVANVVMLVVLGRIIGDDPIGGSGQPQVTLFVAGFVALAVCQATILQFPLALATDREDGTLLRARGIPDGVATYLVGKVAVVLLTVVVNVALVLVTAAVALGAPMPSSASSWLTLLWVLALSTCAATLLGAAVGAMLPGARQGTGWVLLPLMGLMVISGTVIPFTLMPGVVQAVASVFPLRWMAQGVRSALYEPAYAVYEVAGSWQHLETAGVLLAWVVVGAVLAPRLIARTTRRETGSKLEERRHEASRRVGI
jgi:ABC-2 type transport system permease protein